MAHYLTLINTDGASISLQRGVELQVCFLCHIQKIILHLPQILIDFLLY